MARGRSVTISVIIPTLDEAAGIESAIEAVTALHPHEILVADGGSRDGTSALAAARPCRVVASTRGRAVQMNAGAASATGEILLFLHADTRLPPTAFDEVDRALADPDTVGGRFDVRLDRAGAVYRLIETLMNARSRATRIATGDQAIFVRRRVMEDLEFSRRLKRRGRVACLRTRVVTSARRWEQAGPWRTILRMWWLRALYAAGVSPH